MLSRLILIVLVSMLCGCNRENDRPTQPTTKNQAPAGRSRTVDEPFLEHPTGEFKTAVDAMANAIERLRALPQWKDWITFSAQGMGSRTDSYHSAEIQMRK